MGNVGIALKRFLGNKNTISIIGILVGIIVIYFAYNWRVASAIDPIYIPIATQNIPGNTQITDQMVGNIRINRSAVNASRNLIRERNQVIGQYVSSTTTITTGSFFYRGQLVNAQERPALIQNLRPGYALFYLSVNLVNTYGNSIMPGDFIDIFLSAERTGADRRVLFGKFISSIEVLAVLDSAGRDVFSSASNAAPAVLVFALRTEARPNETNFIDLFLILQGATRIRGVTLHPVPRGRDFTENPVYEEPQIASQRLLWFVEANSDLIRTDVGEIITLPPQPPTVPDEETGDQEY